MFTEEENARQLFNDTMEKLTLALSAVNTAATALNENLPEIIEHFSVEKFRKPLNRIQRYANSLEELLDGEE